jgi:hypothetical protein
MINKFLNAKHWQLFLLGFGIPMVFQFLFMFSVVAGMNAQGELDPATFFSFMSFLPIIIVFSMGILFGWFWSIAIGLQNKIPEDVRMKVGKFKVFFFIPLIYISLISLLIFSMMSMIAGMMASTVSIVGVGVIFFLHMFSMVCIFYVMYFAAKTLKTVELQREVSFSDFVGEFILLWFFPIGIWFLQPKINKMMEEEDEFL